MADRQTPEQRLVLAVQDGLSLTVGDLGALVGVHGMTIYKWRWGKLTPSPYQAALLRAFERAVQLGYQPGRGVLSAMLLDRGVPRTLYEILRHAGLDARFREDADGCSLSFDRVVG